MTYVEYVVIFDIYATIEVNAKLQMNENLSSFF